MKKVLLVLMVLSIYGCTSPDINIPRKNGGTFGIDIICIEGVQYYKHKLSGAFAPAFDKDGKIKTCNN